MSQGRVSLIGLAMLVGNAVDRLCAASRPAEGARQGRVRRGNLASVN